MASVIALERGDMENKLHFKGVIHARAKSSLSFKIVARKYMGWYGIKNMNPVGCVVCKSLTNIGLHTFRGMIGYCLKDTTIEHFDVAMKNILDEDIVDRKTLHSIYGRSDLKCREVLTHKNVIDHMYVWHKYKTKRHMTTTFMSILTDMVRSGLFMPISSWIIPFNG